MPTIEPLTAEQLCARCDSSQFAFDTTASLDARTEVLGQQRAVDAIELAIAVKQPGYNLFVLGEPGSGRHSVVRRLLDAKAASTSVLSDWCYVNNFAEPSKPRLLKVPAGRGDLLARDMEQFVAELSRAIPMAFDSDQYQARIAAINGAYKEREDAALQDLGKSAAAEGIALVRTPRGFIFAPLKADEEAMSPEEFDKLPDEHKERIGKLIETYGERLSQLMLQLPRWRRDAQAQIKDASRDTLGIAAGHLIDELKERYGDLAEVLAFLDEVMRDVIEVGEQLREQPKNDDGLATLVMTSNISQARYKVNSLVANTKASVAPVIFEDNPIHPNLVGRIDQIAQFGTLVTNFTLIKPGALHRANGGYLVLDALKVLSQPYAWEGLKRALRSSQVHIESVGQAHGLVGTVPLEPEPMPLSVKVVLIGERRVYYLLKAADPDFADLFKIAADFENDLVRDAQNTHLYAEFVATLARDAGLRPFNRGAVSRLVEHSARLCGDAQRLTTNRRQIADLLQESDHCAVAASHAVVQPEDVEAALEA